MLSYDSLMNAILVLGGGGSVAAFIGWMVFTNLKNKVAYVDEIPGMKARIAALEVQELKHNETRDAVIRMESKVESLTEQVRNFMDLILGKVYNNG